MTSLLSLPTELLERIFINVDEPEPLVRTCKRLRQVSLNPAVRCFWLIHRYGPRNALAASSLSEHIGLIRGEEVGLDTFKLLMQMYPGTIPRFVIQLVNRRLMERSLPPHIIELLSYGMKAYRDLSLGRNDLDEIIFHVFGYDPDVPDEANWESVYYIGDLEKTMDRIKELIDVYNFDLNWTQSEIFYTCESSEDLLARTIEENKTELFNFLLKIGASTFDPLYVPRTAPLIDKFQQFISNARTDTDAASFVKLRFRRYEQWEIFAPKTNDAVLTAAACKRLDMLQKLLEHESTKWTTEWGKCVLCACVQIAVDKEWNDGVDLLFSYFDAIPRDQFVRSQAQLHFDFRLAVNRGDMAAAKSVLHTTGFKFTSQDLESSTYSGYLGRVLIDNHANLVKVVFENYLFPVEMRVQIASRCITRGHALTLTTLITKQAFHPPSSLLEQCITNERPSMLRKLLNLRRVYDHTLDPMFSSWLTTCQSAKCRAVLREWQNRVLQDETEKVAAEESKGKGKKRAAEEVAGERVSKAPAKKTKKAAPSSKSKTKTNGSSSNGSSKNPSSQRSATNGNGGQAASSSTTQPAPAAPSGRTTRNSMKSKTLHNELNGLTEGSLQAHGSKP